MAGIAENVEQLRALYTAELATQDSLIRAAEFEKKRNAKFEVDIIGLMDRIASLETEIRAKSDIISSLSAQRDAAEELKEERERRIAAENESADLRLVVDKLARELEVEKSRRL